MFHLSWTVADFEACLDFYGRTLGARVEVIRAGAANLYLFGGQLTLHRCSVGRRTEAMPGFHFGASVPIDEWSRLRRQLLLAGHAPLLADASRSVTAKLRVLDPAGNSLELNGIEDEPALDGATSPRSAAGSGPYPPKPHRTQDPGWEVSFAREYPFAPEK